MARKAANGAGTIRQRKDGTWEARYTLGRDPKTGKQIQKSIYGKTQNQVRRKLLIVSQQIDSGTYVNASKITVSDWLDMWLDDARKKVKPTTAAYYQDVADFMLKPKIGNILITNLKTSNLDRAFSAMLTDYKASSIRNARNVLNKAIKLAVKNGIIKYNPVTEAETPPVPKTEAVSLDNDKLKLFLDVISKLQNYPFYYVIVFTGMRKSEAIGLTWDRVNFQNRSITIDRQLHYVPEVGYQFAPTKNNETRVIHFSESVQTCLRWTLERQNSWSKDVPKYSNDERFVFTHPDGTHLNHKTVQNEIKRIMTKIGMPEGHLHNLRHTYATLSIQQGVDIKTLSDAMGHASVAFTLDTYGHVTETMREAGAAKIEHLITTLKTEAENKGKPPENIENKAGKGMVRVQKNNDSDK